MKSNFRRRVRGWQDSDEVMTEQIFKEKLESSGDADSNTVRGIFKSFQGAV